MLQPTWPLAAKPQSPVFECQRNNSLNTLSGESLSRTGRYVSSFCRVSSSGLCAITRAKWDCPSQQGSFTNGCSPFQRVSIGIRPISNNGVLPRVAPSTVCTRLPWAGRVNLLAGRTIEIQCTHQSLWSMLKQSLSSPLKAAQATVSAHLTAAWIDSSLHVQDGNGGSHHATCT